MKIFSITVLILGLLVCASCSHFSGEPQASRQIKIMVTGMGNKSGEYFVASGSGIVTVMKEVGANMSYVGGKVRPDTNYRITITRTRPDGSTQTWQFHSFQIDETQWSEFKLRDGDTVALDLMFL